MSGTWLSYWQWRHRRSLPQLINDRLELTGMRWTVQGAESIIRLRAVYINKEWKDFWRFRRKSEKKCLYGIHLKHEEELLDDELAKAA